MIEFRRNGQVVKRVHGRTLAGADLRGLNLTGADLRGMNLAFADLRGACLKKADLRGCNLRNAQLDNCDLRGARVDDTAICSTIFPLSKAVVRPPARPRPLLVPVRSRRS